MSGDLNKRLAGLAGRGSTGFVPKPKAAVPETEPAAPNENQELAAAIVLDPAGPVPDGAREAALAAIPQATATPSNAPRISPAVMAGTLGKLLGEPVSTSERGKAVPIVFDEQLDRYLFAKVSQAKADKAAGPGKKVTMASLIRQALRRPLDPEDARNGKALQRARHNAFKLVKTTVEISEAMAKELSVEASRYERRDNVLSLPLLIELRVLSWAAHQPDWEDLSADRG